MDCGGYLLRGRWREEIKNVARGKIERGEQE
jgi:hypothetical protein